MRINELVNIKQDINEVDLKKIKNTIGAGLIGGALMTSPVAKAEHITHSSMPTTMAELPVKEKKATFFKIVVPLAEKANAHILKQRKKIIAGDDKVWLASMFKQYKVDNVESLLAKVDIVPTSLVVAQAAIESGWGTSRFAQQGNALFGQRDYSGGGIKPKGGGNFTVAKYDNILSSVESYINNINKGWAFEDLRQYRANLRQQNKPVDSISLLPGLKKYSERGHDYIRDVKSVIKYNNLTRFDKM